MSQVVLINHQNPALRYVMPGSGEIVQFMAGRLILEDDDPNRGTILEAAAADPTITILTVDVICDVCGQAFVGKIARADLGKHRKREHGISADANDKVTTVKTGTIFACNVCSPPQTFPDAGSLQTHNTAIHAPLKVTQDEIDNQGDS